MRDFYDASIQTFLRAFVPRRTTTTEQNTDIFRCPDELVGVILIVTFDIRPFYARLILLIRFETTKVEQKLISVTDFMVRQNIVSKVTSLCCDLANSKI